MEKVSLLPLSPKGNQINKAVVELNSLNKIFKSQKESYEKRKSELQDLIKGYTDKHKIEEFGFQAGTTFYKVRPVIQKKIVWYVDKLSKRLDKEILNEVVKKTYTINDFDSLVLYLKSCGVNPKTFKKFIDVKKEVDNKKIDELGELGEIDIEKLSGCYELQANFSYVKISESEDNDGESSD